MTERARVTFRRQRSDPEGQVTTEEREVFCDPETLHQVLAAPWEDSTEPSVRPEALTGALVEQLTSLAFVVAERQETSTMRSWTLEFRRGDGPATPVDEVPEPAEPGSAVQLRGALHLTTPRDQGAADQAEVALGRGRNNLVVHNQGLMVMSRGNAYAIIELNLNVEIRPAGSP